MPAVQRRAGMGQFSLWASPEQVTAVSRPGVQVAACHGTGSMSACGSSGRTGVFLRPLRHHCRLTSKQLTFGNHRRMMNMDSFVAKAGALSRLFLLPMLVCLGSTLIATPVAAQQLRWAPTPPKPAPAASPSMTPPRYKAEWALAGKMGTVVLLLSVNADGSVADVAVETSSGHQELDDAAVEAARTWRFRAPVANGVAVPSKVRVPLDFNPALGAPPPQTE